MADAEERQRLRKQIKELQAKLDKALRERDDLVRDLENMCLSDTSTTFNSSSVLQERIYSTEKELSAVKAALAGLSLERDNLREDLGEVKQAKRRADQGYRSQLERATALDRELAFYQAQSARVMADRDRAVWEGEELKAKNLRLEQQLREASSRAETESAQRAQLERQLSELRTQLRATQAQATEAAVLPGLRQELVASGTEVQRLRGCERELLGQVAQLQEQLGASQVACQEAGMALMAAQRDSDDLAAAHAVVQQQLRGEVQELKSELAVLHERLQRASEAAEEASGRRQAAAAEAAQQRERQEADVEALVAHHAEEVASLRQQVREQQNAAAVARQQVEEATQQKVAVLMRLSEAEGGRTQAGGRIERLAQDLATMREQLEQAKRQKLEALMKLAAAEGGGGGSPGRTDSAKSDASPTARSPASDSKLSPQKKGGAAGWWSSPVKGAAS